MRYAAIVAYDGTDYAGFQRQRNRPSVQQALESALRDLAGRDVRVVGAGRTDAGVHAAGQVIAFDLEWRHGAGDLRAALNARLPDDIALQSVVPAPDKFHPRFDAVSRTYAYQICVVEVRDPLRRRNAWQLDRPLDIPLMNMAAGALIGDHDFTSFGLPPKGENAVRRVLSAVWESRVHGEFKFTITANAFLFRMVRTLTATLAQVGRLAMTGDEFRAILAARRRGLTPAPAPACGLTLTKVTYNPGLFVDADLPSALVEE